MNATGRTKARIVVAKACRYSAMRIFFLVSVQDWPKRAMVGYVGDYVFGKSEALS
jgi:hypothetical protein